ncbi:MAG: peptidoglycan DD-metalloendopeptidase family protein [Pseudoclavibacter sp.]
MNTIPHRPRSAIASLIVAVLSALVFGAALSLAPVAAFAIAPLSHAAAADLDALEGSWSWPVAPPHPVTRPFELTGPYAPGHRGIDLEVAAGASIAAPADGVVRFAGVVVDRPVLSIEHDNGSVSSFEPVDAVVSAGDRVERGHVVGTLSTTVSHEPTGGLHLGARVDGGYLNPLLLLGALAPAVLLPLGDAAASFAFSTTDRPGKEPTCAEPPPPVRQRSTQNS